MISVIARHIAGVARLFWSRAKFDSNFSLRAAQLEITDFIATIFAKQKFFSDIFSIICHSICFYMVIDDL